MMTHLSESEFVDLILDEGTLDPRRLAHVEVCASCRAQAEALGAMLREASSVVLPEPSPLFWQHLSARVRDGLASDPPGRSGWSWLGIRGLVPIGAAAAVVVAVIAGTLMLRAVREGPAPSPIVADRFISSAPSDAGPATMPDADNAEVWDVLTSAASTVGLDEARAVGMHVHQAAIDHAVQDLSAAELTELGRLLRSELKRSSN